MSLRIIDTGDKILTGDNHPQLKIGDKLYLVDDRKSTWDKIQEIQADESVENTDIAVLELALGKEAIAEIINDDITVEGFAALNFYVIAAITGEDYETLRAEARKN